MPTRSSRALPLLALVVGAMSCARPGSSDRAPAPTDGSEYERAAADVVAFLQGRVPFERLRLADSVALHVGRGGGGGTTVVSREALRRRESWAVGAGTRRVSFVPPAGLTRLTTKAGRHFACQEQSLATQLPRLAAKPHVGTRLEPEGGESCLQTWNVTFVFDSTGPRPRVVAAVYDQWEW